jgi:hypothetical protein
MRMKTMEMAVANDASQSYQSGQMVFNGNVQVEYDLVVAATSPASPWRCWAIRSC